MPGDRLGAGGLGRPLTITVHTRQLPYGSRPVRVAEARDVDARGLSRFEDRLAGLALDRPAVDREGDLDALIVVSLPRRSAWMDPTDDRSPRRPRTQVERRRRPLARPSTSFS
jgi:hypothetical protein